jgi:hypothetical protein
VSAIAQTCSQARAALLIAQAQKEEEEEEDESASQETNDGTLDDAIGLPTGIMDAKKKLNLEGTVHIQEFDELLESSFINLLHQFYSSLYQKVVLRAAYDKIVDTCAAYKTEFEKQCNMETAKMINSVFDAIKIFQYE